MHCALASHFMLTELFSLYFQSRKKKGLYVFMEYSSPLQKHNKLNRPLHHMSVTLYSASTATINAIFPFVSVFPDYQLGHQAFTNCAFLSLYIATLSHGKAYLYNTQINTDDSPAFIFIVYSQFFDVSVYHISYNNDTKNTLVTINQTCKCFIQCLYATYK